MTYKNSPLLQVASAAVLALAAASSHAAPTVCAVSGSTPGPGKVGLNLAVASNFYTPALNLANSFLSAVGGVDYVRVCHNSTGHLDAEIRNGTDLPPDLGSPTAYPYNYGVLFAANRSTPQAIAASYPSKAGTEYQYAQGISAFVAKSGTVSTVGGLVNGLGSGTSATITGSASGYTLASGVPWVAVADPAAAPYGLAAKTVLSDMGYAWIPPFVHPTLFANIDLTLDSLGTTVGGNTIKTAFVSKAQVCNGSGGVNSAYTAVVFDNYGPSQGTVVLDKSNAAAVAFNDYVQYLMTHDDDANGRSDWKDFIVPRCYK